jgi:DNA-binding response OmpR family regulator
MALREYLKRLEKITILYVEDEEKLIKSYAPFLKEYCQSLYIARNGQDAYQLYRNHRPNIILFDIYLPKMNGVELAKKIRREDSETTLIALTAYSDRKILLELIDLHLLGYLIKPVGRSALIGTLVKAAERINARQQMILPYGCSWDAKSNTLFYEDTPIALTKREMSFISLMLKKQGTPSSEEEIFFHVWSDKYHEGGVTNTSIRTLVKNLRKKLPRGLIKSQYGLGYKIEV